jgi:hypothetical protein
VQLESRGVTAQGGHQHQEDGQSGTTTSRRLEKEVKAQDTLDQKTE